MLKLHAVSRGNSNAKQPACGNGSTKLASMCQQQQQLATLFSMSCAEGSILKRVTVGTAMRSR